MASLQVEALLPDALLWMRMALKGERCHGVPVLAVFTFEGNLEIPGVTGKPETNQAIDLILSFLPWVDLLYTPGQLWCREGWSSLLTDPTKPCWGATVPHRTIDWVEVVVFQNKLFGEKTLERFQTEFEHVALLRPQPRTLAVTEVEGPYTFDVWAKAVTKHFKISLEELQGPQRRPAFCRARHLLMYLLKQEGLCEGSRDIGRYFGNRDHSTVLSSIKVARRRLKTEPGARSELAQVRKLADYYATLLMH